MSEELKTADTNTKTQLSLAAALFFSPLVQNMLKENTRDITEKDREFIHGYIKFGYITILFGLITIVTGIMNYFFVLKFLNVIYTISIFILIFLLFISIVSILSDIRLLKGDDALVENYAIEGSKKDIILKYLPGYNIYLRYKEHSFDKPNWRIKESILLWAVFTGISMIGNNMIDTILLILVITRIAAIMSDIDFVNTTIKQHINILFLKNPEEIFGYVTGLFVYLWKAFIHLFSKIESYSLQNEIAKEKEVYSRIIDIPENKNIIIEYILGIILVSGLVYLIQPDFTVRTYYVGFLLLITRYLIMAVQLKHLPHLPIAREIMLLLKGIGSLFAKKSFTINK
ncbi:MAG: hypothetical protein NTY80_02325 [candidate division SR1 bacterium]|nr:hypothetical protein [candidate division SR1 bacterium]